MGEFTGNYNRCIDCWHIYDFNDICPNCGGSEIEELNENDVKEWAKMCVDSEAKRLHKMLQLHGGKCSNENSVLPILLQS